MIVTHTTFFNYTRWKKDVQLLYETAVDMKNTHILKHDIIVMHREEHAMYAARGMLTVDTKLKKHVA